MDFGFGKIQSFMFLPGSDGTKFIPVAPNIIIRKSASSSRSRADIIIIYF
jgi:hypothetical protein